LGRYNDTPLEAIVMQIAENKPTKRDSILILVCVLFFPFLPNLYIARNPDVGAAMNKSTGALEGVRYTVLPHFSMNTKANLSEKRD
jgi:hypothetical protein